MKSLPLTIAGSLSFLIMPLSSFSQTETLTLQPGSAGIDASLGYHDGYSTDGNNYGSDVYFKAYCLEGADGWGSNNNRGLITFDLTSIPAGATIISASLELYATGFINSVLPGHSGSNAAYLSRVLSPWQESSVTWNSEPQLSTSDRVSLAPSTSFDQDYSIDVTSMVTDMYNTPSSNYGFHLGLVTENPNNPSTLAFFSSDASNSTKRPKLIVNYRTSSADLSEQSMQQGSLLELNLAPNPVSTTLKVKVEEGLQSDEITVLDVNGQQILCDIQQLSDESIQIDVANLPKGIYFVRLIHGKIVVSERFVKM